MEEKIIVKNLSLTGILKWLIENYKNKKSGKPFNIQDVQGYVRRGSIPLYLGGFKVTIANNKYSKLYNLVNLNEV